MDKNSRTEIEARVTEILRDTLPTLVAIYAFGSAGTSYERVGSDVDLAILDTRPLDPLFIWELGERTAAAIGRDVDLVDLRLASTVMVAGILAEGTRVFCRDEARCAEFEAYAFSDYARLNEERSDILADIRTRGRVHG